MRNKKLSQGQSLIEVVAALGVVVLVITALAVVVTLSIANAKFSQNQTQASKYGQEVLEKLRAYRDKNKWDEFTSNCGDSTVLDLSDLPPTWEFDITCEPCSGSELICRKVVVEVGWRDAKDRLHESKLETNFTSWRE